MIHPRKATGVLLVTAAAALAAAGSGNARSLDTGQSGLNICGPKSHVNLSGAIDQQVPLTYNSSLKAAAPAEVQPFYRINLNASSTCATSLTGAFTYFIPGTGEIEILGKSSPVLWVKLHKDVAKTLRDAVRDVKPYPPPTDVFSVSVDHREATNPSSYLRLYRIGRPVRRVLRGVRWLQISIFGSSAPSPWTDGRNAIFVSKRGHNYLKRDGQLVRINASVATRIRKAQSLRK